MHSLHSIVQMDRQLFFAMAPNRLIGHVAWSRDNRLRKSRRSMLQTESGPSKRYHVVALAKNDQPVIDRDPRFRCFRPTPLFLDA